jgi:hypothetical protein
MAQARLNLLVETIDADRYLLLPAVYGAAP